MPDSPFNPLGPSRKRPERVHFSELSDEENAKLNDSFVVPGGPKIPDAPDIAAAPKGKKSKEKVPSTFKNSIDGLTELRPDELPVVAKHYVVWGLYYMDDVRPRRVRTTVLWTEDEHVRRELALTQALLDRELKNPKTWTDPKTSNTGFPPDTPGTEEWDRLDRTERYARWRYRGYVCGEVASL